MEMLIDLTIYETLIIQHSQQVNKRSFIILNKIYFGENNSWGVYILKNILLSC